MSADGRLLARSLRHLRLSVAEGSESDAWPALAGVTGLATSRMMVGWLGDVAGGREIMRTLQGKLPSRAERTFEPTGKEIPTSFGKHGYR